MKKCILLIVILFAAKLQAQQITKVNSQWLFNMKTDKSDTLYLINFWATWCKPCVEELPIFNQLDSVYKKQKIKIILVSTDMRKDYDKKLPDFITQHQLKQQIVFMDELNADLWINQVNENWSGAIPATWLIKGSIGFEHFKEGETSFEEMQSLINQIITQK